MLHHGGVDEKRRAGAGEAQGGSSFFQFRNHQHGAEVCPEGRHQRQFEGRQRIDHHLGGVVEPDGHAQREQACVDGIVQPMYVGDGNVPTLHELVDSQEALQQAARWLMFGSQIAAGVLRILGRGHDRVQEDLGVAKKKRGAAGFCGRPTIDDKTCAHFYLSRPGSSSVRSPQAEINKCEGRRVANQSGRQDGQVLQQRLRGASCMQRRA